mmetsp:Transcript_11413/g.32327  ORF Transcript_11413/g.32327 Transcript_11413/m.32327 type:complete len:115 (+) Transcript_11413:2-346(+)
MPGFGPAGAAATGGGGGAAALFFLEEDAGFFFPPLLPADEEQVAVGEDTEQVWRPSSGSQSEAGGQHRQLPQEGQSPFFHERWASQGMLPGAEVDANRPASGGYGTGGATAVLL